MSKFARSALPIAVCLALGSVALCNAPSAAAAGPASASKPTTSANKQKAAARFAKAKSLYKAGKYRAALDQLEAARKLDPEGAELVYNMGVIYEKLTDIDSAIEHYRQYVEMIPDEQEKERVRGIIRRLEGAKKDLAPPPKPEPEPQVDQPKPTAEPEPRPEPPAPAKKGRMDGLVVASGVVAGAGLVAGTVFGIMAMGDRVTGTPTTGNGTSYQDLQDRQDNAKREALFADIGFGVAVVAGVAGAVLYFTRDAPRDESRPAPTARAVPSVAVLPGGMVAGVGMRF